MKILGAWIIAYGLLALGFGAVGLQIRFLFVLDAFGPVMGYVLKFAFIALGVWIWRRDEMMPDDSVPTEEENHRAWVPVAVCVAGIVGIAGFITVKAVKNSRLEHQLQRPPPTATWAAKSTILWPTMVLMQEAKFAHHTPMEAGCASLVRLPTGEIVALTAGHLLGRAGGVSPGFIHDGIGGLDKKKLATLNSEISSWELFLPDDERDKNVKRETIKVTGLYGDAGQWDEDCDQVLLALAPSQTNFPATPLDLRLTPITVKEQLHVVTYSWDFDGNVRQVIHNAHLIPGTIFQCELEKPTELEGFSGAPVLDENGLLVGIVTGGTLRDLGNQTGYVHAFSGHLAKELMPVLKPAVESKGTPALPPIKAVFSLPVPPKNDAGPRQVNNSI
jgi:hypothetical protein